MTTEHPLGSSYVLQDVIGRGAMGQVWRGRDADGHPLAFKVLRPELTEDPKVVQRFVQERSILTSIRHPNVVSVRDLVVEGDTLAIVMDLVAGGDLREMLSSPRTLPPARVAELGAGIAAGLAAVHAAGVIHRDVKPENVLVDASSSPGRPRLTDFGIAKYVAQDGARRAGTMLVGTPQYIAPELIDGKEPTSATDLYALGIMLYELACGVTPFAGGSTMAVLRNHAERLPGRPPGVPDSLWDLISWLLGKHAASRPQSASQVATLLDALVPELAGLPAAEALHEPPEPPEPSVHTQLTEMAMRPVTTAPVAVDAGGLDPDRAAPTPRKNAAGPRPLMLIGVLTAALLLTGGGLVGAKLMNGSSPTQPRPKTPAIQTPAIQTPTRTPASTSARSTSALQTPASTSAPGTSGFETSASTGTEPQPATGIPNATPWMNVIDAPGSARGPVPAAITDAPGNGCTPSTGSVAGYRKVTCHTRHPSSGLHGEGVLGVGSQWILCQQDLRQTNPVFQTGQTNSWWFWTLSDNGVWDWFPETALEEGASDNPVNGIPLCSPP
jgi:serine/threonine protein kinase